MSARATARHTRPKKLTPKQNVQIFREEQVDNLIDFDAQRGQIETGVDKSEESEYHLQQAIRASQAAKDEAKLKDAYIPTPPTIASNVQYDVLYPKGFQQPATYIRSSATVEDCQGVGYDMDEDDEIALKKINSSLPSGTQPCSDDQFEEVMYFFEETAQTKQPFAAVGNAPVLTLTEMEEQYDELVPQYVRLYAKYVYEHWQSRRTSTHNRTLVVGLKFETGLETDDTDPYVCFRRRELRQIRKTRNRDAQSADKLRRLRMELETARNLLAAVKSREQYRKQQLDLDRQLFEQRQAFKDTKRKLSMKADDDLLVNQKKQKLPPGVDPQQAALAQQLRIPMGSGQGQDLQTLDDVRAAKDRAIEADINVNIKKHVQWNDGFVDKTTAPLTPVSVRPFLDTSSQFLEAIPSTEYLPTPPASVSEDESHETHKGDVEMKDAPQSQASTPAFRYASPVEDDSSPGHPSFRRRVGRGGRVLIDRRMPPMWKREKDDRFKFDYSDDDDDHIEEVESNIDADIFARMSHRSYLLKSSTSISMSDSQRRAAEASSASNRSPQTGQGSQPQQQPQPPSQPTTITTS